MACTIAKGRHYKALVQFTDSVDYGIAPTTPNPLNLRFNTLVLNTNPIRQQDPTITDRVLMEKSDEVDQTPDGSGSSITDLNATMYWALRHMFGAPVTTGTGPFVHVFTMTNDCKPDGLLSLERQVRIEGVLQKQSAEAEVWRI